MCLRLTGVNTPVPFPYGLPTGPPLSLALSLGPGARVIRDKMKTSSSVLNSKINRKVFFGTYLMAKSD